jgi:hypothetical protein
MNLQDDEHMRQSRQGVNKPIAIYSLPLTMGASTWSALTLRTLKLSEQRTIDGIDVERTHAGTFAFPCIAA